MKKITKIVLKTAAVVSMAAIIYGCIKNRKRSAQVDFFDDNDFDSFMDDEWVDDLNEEDEPSNLEKNEEKNS
jgi:hypothetical protein